MRIRLPRLRFSLRTLVVGVCLIGSAGGLWWRWEPWVLEDRVAWTTNTHGRYSTPAYGMVITLDRGMGSMTPAEEPLALPSKPSIAVLPFTNMSRDDDQEYFADGLVEYLSDLLWHGMSGITAKALQALETEK